MSFTNVLESIISAKTTAIINTQDNIAILEAQIEAIRQQIERQRQDITSLEVQRASLGEASQAIESALLQAAQAVSTINSVLSESDASEATELFKGQMIAVLESQPEPQQVIALLEPASEVIEVATEVIEVATEVIEETASEPLDVDVEQVSDSVVEVEEEIASEPLTQSEEIASEAFQQPESEDMTLTEDPQKEVATHPLLPTMTEIIATKRKSGIISHLDRIGLTYDKADSLADLKSQLKAYVLSQSAAA